MQLHREFVVMSCDEKCHASRLNIREEGHALFVSKCDTYDSSTAGLSRHIIDFYKKKSFDIITNHRKQMQTVKGDTQLRQHQQNLGKRLQYD